MALPSILPYTMPDASALPENRVSWRPESKRAVLLIHDMQNYFVNAFTPGQSPVTELVHNIQLLKEKCAGLGIPVVYSAQPGGQTPDERGLQQDFWGKGIDGGPDQKQIIELLAPAEDDTLLTKWRYSAFQKTGLEELMQRKGRDQLIICGIYAHIGCLMTACEAFMKDIQPFYIADAVADFSLDHHKMALTYAAERCAVVLPAGRLIDELTSAGGQAAAAGSGEAVLSFVEMREQVAKLLDEPAAAIADQDNLINHWGLDSVRIMMLVEKWRLGGKEVTFVDLAERPTLSEWWSFLSACSGRKEMPNIDYYAQ